MVIYRTEGEDKKDAWIRYIIHRVYANNQNFLGGIVGSTGSGKTYMGLYLLEQIAKRTNKEFNIDHVVFTFEEFIHLINSYGENIPPGTLILFDEPQVDLNARAWQSDVNKAMNSITSTFRHRRCIVLFALPYMSMIDKNTRNLFHAKFSMTSLDKNNKLASCEPHFLDYDDKLNKIYYKQLMVRFKVPGKNRMQSTLISKWKTGLASEELISQYEKKKSSFTSKLNKELEQNLINKREKTGNSRDNVTLLHKIKQSLDKNGQDYLKIALDVNCSPVTARQYVRLLNKEIAAI